jgi:hypothetical protein
LDLSLVFVRDLLHQIHDIFALVPFFRHLGLLTLELLEARQQ